MISEFVKIHFLILKMKTNSLTLGYESFVHFCAQTYRNLAQVKENIGISLQEKQMYIAVDFDWMYRKFYAWSPQSSLH